MWEDLWVLLLAFPDISSVCCDTLIESDSDTQSASLMDQQWKEAMTQCDSLQQEGTGTLG